MLTKIESMDMATSSLSAIIEEVVSKSQEEAIESLLAIARGERLSTEEEIASLVDKANGYEEEEVKEEAKEDTMNDVTMAVMTPLGTMVYIPLRNAKALYF